MSLQVHMKALADRDVDPCESSHVELVFESRVCRRQHYPRDVRRGRNFCFRVIDIWAGIQFDPGGNRRLKTHPEVDIPGIFDFRRACKGRPISGPRNAVREIAERIGPLDEGTDPEDVVDGIESLGPQRAE